MPFTPNIPTAAQQISASQPQIQGNFNSILAAFDQNHADFNAGLNIAGQHTFVQLLGQAAWAPLGAAPSVGFWANVAHSIFLHNAAGTDVNISTLTNPSGNNYFFYLPCGLLIKMGSATTDATGHLVVPIDLNTIGAAYTVIPFALATPQRYPLQNPPPAPPVVGFTRYADVRMLSARYLDFNTRGPIVNNGPIVDAPATVDWVTIGY